MDQSENIGKNESETNTGVSVYDKLPGVVENEFRSHMIYFEKNNYEPL